MNSYSNNSNPSYKTYKIDSDYKWGSDTNNNRKQEDDNDGWDKKPKYNKNSGNTVKGETYQDKLDQIGPQLLEKWSK